MDGEPKVGDVLDSRYRITGLLGQGGMGAVYRAEHVTIKRSVAIKVLHKDFAEDPDYAKRFEREAFVTGRADHANCVTISDFGPLSGGGFYLVMELVDGELLADVMDDVIKLPWPRALHIGRHILRGLGHAHKAGIVHRDVKPTNVILVEQDGDKDFAKILDFGIAKLVDAAVAGGDNNQLTRIGTTVGTPTYIAPEQAVGGQVDARSDLYSVSILLYEMIVGRPPFRDDDTIKLLAKHLSAPVPAMAEFAPDLAIPPDIEQLIVYGLAKSKEDRYTDAAAYIAAIDQALARYERGELPLAIAGAAPSPPAPMAAPTNGYAQTAEAPLTPPPGNVPSAFGYEQSGPYYTPPPPAMPTDTPPPSVVVDSSAGEAEPSRPLTSPTSMLDRATTSDPLASGALATVPPVRTGTMHIRTPGSKSWRKYAKLGAIGLGAIILLAVVTSDGDSRKKAGGGKARPSMSGSLLDNAEMRKLTLTPEQSKARAQALERAEKAALDRRPEQALAILDKEFGKADGDAEVQLVRGHALMADGRPGDGLRAYSRVVALDKGLASGNEQLRRNAGSLLGVRRTELSAMALEILGQLDDEESKKLLAQAASDRRNEIRLRARELAKRAGVEFDKLISYSLDLRYLKSCEERAQAIPKLLALGDKRALPALKKARRRRAGGLLGIGASSVNGCMRDQLDRAIAKLEG